MDTIDIDLSCSDSEVAKALLEAAPPEGVRVSGSPHPIIRAAEGTDIVFQISLHFSHTDLVIVAAWVAKELSHYLRKRHKEKTRINDQELSPTQEQVLVLMREIIHWQQVREAQWQETQQKKLAGKNEPIEKPDQKAQPSDEPNRLSDEREG